MKWIPCEKTCKMDIFNTRMLMFDTKYTKELLS